MRSPRVPTDPLCAQFLSELHVRELVDGRKQLLADLWFYSAAIAKASGGSGIVGARKGTIVNYASSPRLFWSIVPPDGPWTYPAVLHDAASQGDLITETGQRIHLVKHLTDNLFREAMSVPPCDVVPAWKRWIMYQAVKRYGTGAYGGTGLVPATDADISPAESSALSGLEFCPRCGSGPRQRADVDECPDCGRQWEGPRLLGLLEATPIGDAIDRLGSSGEGFDATVTAAKDAKPSVTAGGWKDFGTRDQFGAGGSVSWAQKAWAAIAKVTWRPGKR